MERSTFRIVGGESGPLTQHFMATWYVIVIPGSILCNSRSQWPSGLRHWSAATRLLRSWIQIPPEAWMFVCCECCVLSGRGLCDELIARPEEFYRL